MQAQRDRDAEESYPEINGSAKILWEADSIEEAARELKERKKQQASPGDSE